MKHAKLKVIQAVDEKPRREPAYITRVVTETQYDCLACGACCRQPPDGKPIEDGWTDVTPHDVARLTRKEFGDAVIKDEAEKKFLIRLVNHPEDGLRCYFLGGRLGTRAPCKIYQRRPTTCDVFTMGSRACLDARKMAGMDV